jgi:transcriptional regulator with XRE-family HTH domain
MTPLSVRVADLRAAKGWTIDKLAEESGVSRATIIRLEQKQTTRVDFDVLEKLADALGVNASVLIDHRPAARGKKQ